ncbi:S8 family serine peptidase [Rothia nasimurium]|uniref:S8 family serine peptidase n=1 Tax=Rothia nasimurium TaxID=85336 RepID=UPI002DD6B0E7|nr:S8 family serine peptidase [Rothia nasimurium]
MTTRHTTRRFVRAGAASVLGLSMALTLGLPPVNAAEDADLFKSVIEQTQSDEVLSPSMKQAQGEVSVFVQFRGAGAYESTQPAAVLQGKQPPVNAQRQVQAIAAAVQSQGRSVASESGATVLYTAHNSIRGAAIRGDAEKIRELASRSDVVKISPIVSKTRANTGSALLTQAAATWQQTGYTGEGVKIAIIDSGVDYTHSQFGGPGTQEAYEQASHSAQMPSANSGLYDPEKYLGGYDLAGDDYNAANAETATPSPDTNPLDCRANGHGTHVAGTAAGYAVQQDGSAFKGDYTKLTEEQMQGMKIGSGSAPNAQIVDFRIFGCDGSTDLTGQALDRSLDPNNDGIYDDRVDIINMSLGSDFGAQDDPENAIVDALTRQGILSVVAAGNSTAADGNGDTYSVSGNPANARSALAVANTVGATTYADTAEITAPSSLAGTVTGDYSVEFNYHRATEEQLTGQVVMAPENNKFGCDAFPEGTDFEGKWVFIDWTDNFETFPCGSAVRFNNLEAAGAKGVVLASNLDVETVGIAGNRTIPGIRLNLQHAERVRAAIQQGEEVTIKLSPEGIAAATIDSGMQDQVNESTARGVHGSRGYTKPDVAAPGTNIGSAGVGAGTDMAVMSGTSMASPHVAGVAALVREANQSYSAQQVKAAIMNSAVHDVKTATGEVHSIERVGSGRIDALQAVNQKVLVYSADNPDQVSESLGVVEVLPDAGVQTYTRELTIDNSDSKAHTYQVSFEASSDLPGVTISAPQSVSVNPGGTNRFTVTVTVDPAQLEKKLESASAATQLDRARQYLSAESGRLILTEGDTQTRLPLHIAPKPVSDMKSATSAVNFGNGRTSANIDLEGTPLHQGGYVSLVGAYELGATSNRMKTSSLAVATSQRVDLQYVGAASNVPALRAAGQPVDEKGMMSIGVSTWDNWENLTNPTSIEVAFDVDGNFRPDYYLYTSRERGLDYPQAVLIGWVNGKLEVLDRQPINGAYGDVDTNTFDSNVLNLPVSLSKMGIDASNAANLRYSVDTYSWYQTGGVDGTNWISYNPYNPKVWFDGDQSESATLFVDHPDADITVHRASTDVTDAKALLLHMHNGTGDLSGVKPGEDGGKAEIVSLNEAKPATNLNPRFTDVGTDYVFYDEIAWLAERGITTGWPDGTFRPGSYTERGQMAAFFYRLAGSPQYTAPSVSPFKDVPTTHVFYKEIAWMHSMGITKGWSDGTFRPHAYTERGQMAAFFYRMAGSPTYTAPSTSAFKDLPTDYVFFKEISWMQSQGITKGWSDGTFRPSAYTERGQMAAFIYRFDQNVDYR